jgi:hypothetical protein
MMFFERIMFGAPWMLGFLALLPVVWFLVRLTPPAPMRVIFPALFLLQNLVTAQQTPSRTPWWLLLLRLLIVTLIVVGFSKPIVDPLPPVPDNHGLLIIVDNDWASSRDWTERATTLDAILQQASREGRRVAVLPTTADNDGTAPTLHGPYSALQALDDIKKMTPKPWSTDWDAVTKIIKSVDKALLPQSLWLTSGIGGTHAKLFYDTLEKRGGAKVIATGNPLYWLQTNNDSTADFSVFVQRLNVDNAATIGVKAVDREGNSLMQVMVSFALGAPRAIATFDGPIDLRNNIARFEIASLHTAASTLLLDSTSQHRSVGIVGDAATRDQNSLLNDLTYLDRALKPFADVQIASLSEILKQPPSVIIVTDATPITEAEAADLNAWMKSGGVFVRFAGERLATSPTSVDATLLPVVLRTGDRTLGGALSWATPQHLQKFPLTGAFQDLVIPDDVTVKKQILAEPDQDLTGRTWATLQDGTPLVTAKPIGQGLTILFHIPARADWSNLPLSGLFVGMMQRIVSVSHGGLPKVGESFTNLPPLQILDAYGDAGAPPTANKDLNLTTVNETNISPDYPPGLYGRDGQCIAFNLGDHIDPPIALRDIPIDHPATTSHEIDLQPLLLAFAFLLLLLDAVISLYLRGHVSLPRSILPVLFFLCVTLSPHSGHAADPSTLTAQTTLGYIQTGERETDNTSAAGMMGLARILEIRTSLDHVDVAAIDPNTDDLAFYPLIYWPVVPQPLALTATGIDHINNYLHHGGMILFDAANDADMSPDILRQVMRGIDLPQLIPVPDNHVLTRSFYLLQDFPGRFTGHNFWLEPDDVVAHDGVATILFGSNAWAAAWALDKNGRTVYPCMPGGELQREQAFRFGINLVMYALTGNYKSDQMHVQALLDRVGH